MSRTLMAIFRKQKNKTSTSNQRDVENILQLVEQYDDNSKAMDLLFLNFLNVSFTDPTLERCFAANDWLSTVDLYRSLKSTVASNNTSEHYAIQKCHIPCAAAAIHLLCRTESRPELSFSLRPLLDTIYQLEANNGLIDKFLEGLSPSARSGVHKNHFATDILSYCMKLLSAGSGSGSLTRSVSSIDILTKEERAAFNAHVELLRTLGLTYVQVNTSEHDNDKSSSVVELRLEPEIDKLLKYNGVKRGAGVPSAMKELLAHAANVESLKKNDEMQKKESLHKTKERDVPSKASSETKDLKAVVEESPETKRDETRMKRKASSNFLGIGAAKAKAARTARKAAMLGFGRSKNKTKPSNTGSGVPIDQVIRFKFQKGFTQAVRLPCGSKDMLV